MIRKAILATIIGSSILCGNLSWGATDDSSTATLIPLPGPGHFSNVYFFGDSLSDIGNFHTDAPDYLQENAPVTNSTGSHSFPGGWLWVNYFARHYNIDLVTYKSNPNQANVFAVAGATTQDVYDARTKSGQIMQYLQHQQADPNALYVIWAGANDLLALSNADPNQPTKSPNEVLLDGINNIFNAIVKLYSAGARNFLIIDLPDVSFTPAASDPNREPQYDNVFEKKDGIQEFCDAWDEILFSPNPDAIWNHGGPLAFLQNDTADFPGLKIYVWDSFFAIEQILQNITSGTNRYCANDNSDCFSQMITTPDGQSYYNNQIDWSMFHEKYPHNNLNPSNFMFFNYIHPSSHANAILAQLIMRETHRLQVIPRT